MVTPWKTTLSRAAIRVSGTEIFLPRIHFSENILKKADVFSGSKVHFSVIVEFEPAVKITGRHWRVRWVPVDDRPDCTAVWRTMESVSLDLGSNSTRATEAASLNLRKRPGRATDSR
jgi:hypothetical protein